jgi:flagellar biosynthetic protein FlhB
MAGDREQRTEAPTRKRKKESREQGQVLRSMEVITWGGAIVSVFMLAGVFQRGQATLTELMTQMGQLIERHDERAAMDFFGAGMMAALTIVGPLAAAMLIVGLLTNIAQIGLHFTPKLIAPKLKRINPFSGLKRMFSMTTVWETAKSIAKVAALAAISWPALTGLLTSLTATGGSFSDLAAIAGNTTMQIIRNIVVVGVIIALADYIYQRKKYLGQVRMTKQEVKEEYKQQEGDQMVRATRKARARAMSRNRAISLASTADVVLMNPTHYAVALKYDPTKGAPEVVAKGAGDLALRIRDIALEAGVAVVQDPPLTRALYRICDLGDQIPVVLYEAIARILAFVFGLKRRGFTSGVQKMPGDATLLPPELAELDRKVQAQRRRALGGAASHGGGSTSAVGAVSLD